MNSPSFTGILILQVLLCENTIELVSLKNIAEAADYLHGVTRMLMAEPYKYEDDELNTTKRYSKRMKAVEGASAAEKNQHMVVKTSNIKSNKYNSYNVIHLTSIPIYIFQIDSSSTRHG